MNQQRKHGRRPGTIQEMRQVCQQWALDPAGKPILAGSRFNRHVLRPISIYLTWFFVAMGVRAHAVTLAMTAVGLVGIALCVPHVVTATIVGVISLFLFDLLDAVDGEIARWNQSSSTKGLYLDQVSHVLIDYPSAGIAALHYYVWTAQDLYLVLAICAAASAVLGRTIREIFFRINAEALCEGNASQESSHSGGSEPGPFLRLCSRLKSTPLTSFSIVKARVVHISTLIAILFSYAGITHLLVFLSWFYAIYCTARLLLEIPYFYWNRVIDLPHSKKTEEYHWPI